MRSLKQKGFSDTRLAKQLRTTDVEDLVRTIEEVRDEAVRLRDDLQSLETKAEDAMRETLGAEPRGW